MKIIEAHRRGGKRRVAVMGVSVDNLLPEEAVSHIVSAAGRREGGWVFTPNVDILRQIQADPELALLVSGADLCLADGMPIVWASRLQGTPLVARLAMSELIHPIAAAAARENVSIFLLGDTPEVGRDAAIALCHENPSLRIEGTLSPPVGFETVPGSYDAIVEELRLCHPGIVVCAFGFPKQERLIAELVPRLPGMWFLAAGATLSIAAGRTPPAPQWMRDTGLEWLHRLRLEPRRLLRRYAVSDMPFAVQMLARCAREGLRSNQWSHAGSRRIVG